MSRKFKRKKTKNNNGCVFIQKKAFDVKYDKIYNISIP